MASWMSDSYVLPWDLHKPLDIIDFFAGAARIAKIGTIQGYACRAYDYIYDTPPPGESSHSKMPRRSAFDFCGEAGFWFLRSSLNKFLNRAHQTTFFWGKKMYSFLYNLCRYLFWTQKHFTYHKPCMYLRLAVLLVLQGVSPGMLACLGPVCSSWSIVNRGTSQRDELTPLGNCRNTKVIQGNRMISRRLVILCFATFWNLISCPTQILELWGLASISFVCRTALLALLVALLGGYFVIENPASSFICWHPDLLWMIGAMRRAGIKETHVALTF